MTRTLALHWNRWSYALSLAPVRLAVALWLVLIYYEKKLLLVGWWLVLI